MTDEELQDLSDEIGRMAQRRSVRIAAAESLTSGAIASAFGRGAEASEWLSVSPEPHFWGTPIDTARPRYWPAGACR